MTAHRPPSDHRISRRDLLRTAAVGSGLALLAGSSSWPALAAAPAAQGGAEFHGAWPFELPPNGHFNYAVTPHAILRGGIYDDLITLPMAMY